jgi:hypothetical protein
MLGPASFRRLVVDEGGDARQLLHDVRPFVLAEDQLADEAGREHAAVNVSAESAVIDSQNHESPHELKVFTALPSELADDAGVVLSGADPNAALAAGSRRQGPKTAALFHRAGTFRAALPNRACRSR